MLAIVFAAVMLVAGQLFIKSRSATIMPLAQASPIRVPADHGPKRPDLIMSRSTINMSNHAFDP